MATPCLRGRHSGIDAALATLDDMIRDDVSLRMDLLFERGRAGAAAGAVYWERGIADLWTVVDLAEEAGDVLRATPRSSSSRDQP